MGLKEWIIPQEKQFFDMLEREAANVLKGVEALRNMLLHYENINEKRKHIKDIESAGDAIVHGICKELNRTFITPIDREDINGLTSALDDILDYVEAVAERLVIYKVEKPPKHLIEFADMLVDATENVHKAISRLKNLKHADRIREYCEEMNRIENSGDTLLRVVMADLFTGKDPIEIMKFKELYENLETAIDKCEDAADVIGDVLVKYA